MAKYKYHQAVEDMKELHDKLGLSSLVNKLETDGELGMEFTLQEIGYILGVTRERVRQIEAGALKRLRHPTRGGRQLKEYFKDYDTAKQPTFADAR